MTRTLFSPASVINLTGQNCQAAPARNAALESNVQVVAANFRCACGGCGELFLIDCICDMPRGATEEKDFIRRNLQQGLSINEVITRVENEYGHRLF